MEHLRDELVKFLKEQQRVIEWRIFSAQEVLRLADEIIEIVQKEGIK